MCPRQTLKKLPASFRFFFAGTRVFYLKPLLWRDFLLHYSLLFDRVSRVSLSHPPYQNKMTVSTLSLSSPVVTDPAESRPLREVRRCSVDVVAVGDGGSRCAPSSRSRRWCGRRSSAPLFAAVVWAVPARPPKRHLAHLRYNFLYWSSSPGRCVPVFFYATTPQLPMHSS